MYKLNSISMLCIIIILELSLISGQEMCPPNEIPAECEDSCNTCDNDGRQLCPLICIPGCRCLPGYTRDDFMNCIPRQFCSGFTNAPVRGPPQIAEDGLLGGLLGDLQGLRGGCPNTQVCTSNCNRRQLKSGVCLGPKKEYCNCYGVISNGNQSPLSSGNQSPLSSGNQSPLSNGNQSPQGRPGGSSSQGCPDLSKCILGCQKRKHASGFCSGGKCNCVELPSDKIVGRNYNPYAYPTVLKPPVVPRPPFVPRPPVAPIPPVAPKPPAALTGDCPNVAKCVTKCIQSGKAAGFCSGFQRRTCQCI